MRNKWIVFGIIVSLLFSSGIIWSAPKEDVTFYHCDALGTPIAMTNMQGNVVWRGNCLPFGEEFSGTGSRNTEIRYTGKPYSTALGLYDLGARYYDPNVGRFTSTDPVIGDISDPQRLNSYAYGLNSPYKYIDPDGGDPIVGTAVISGLGLYFIGSAAIITTTHIVRYNTDPGYRAFCQDVGRTAGTQIGEAWNNTVDLGSQAIDVMFSRPADKAGGQFEVISQHLANVTGSPMGGFDPDPNKKDKNEKTIKHWMREIKTALENIKKLGLSEKQLMRDLQQRGFTKEQIQQVTSTLKQQGVDASGLP